MSENNPWGSLRNKALDALGLWTWNGARGVDGTPYRWKLFYQCSCRMERLPPNSNDQPFFWSAEAPDPQDSGYCPYCSRPIRAYDVEDLLLDAEICPVDLED